MAKAEFRGCRETQVFLSLGDRTGPDSWKVPQLGSHGQSELESRHAMRETDLGAGSWLGARVWAQMLLGCGCGR